MQKKIKHIFSFFLFLPVSCMLMAQSPSIEILTSGTNTSIRGLSVVNDNVVWVSGSNGTVGRSNNGGKNWNWFVVKGFEKADFRDIEAFDANTAIIMAIGEPAHILKTTDGGESWKIVFEKKTKGMFLDAMHFVGSNGIIIGDPINNKIFIAATADAGDSWQEWPDDKRPAADSGEAFFAASGTNIRLFRNNDFYMVSGGAKSRLFTNASVLSLPVIQGKETTGANSIAVFDEGYLKGSKRMIIVGGDFNKLEETGKNCFITTDGGKTWKAPKTPPHGYRSCVEYLSKKYVISCGLNGVDISYNNGKDWQWISKESFHVCRIAKLGRSIFLAGNNGKIAKVNLR